MCSAGAQQDHESLCQSVRSLNFGLYGAFGVAVCPESAKSREPYFSRAATATGYDYSLLAARSEDDRLLLSAHRAGQ